MEYALIGIGVIAIIALLLKVWDQSKVVERTRKNFDELQSITKETLAVQEKRVDQQHRMLELSIERENELNSRLFHIEQTYEQKLQVWKLQEEKRIREDAVTKSRQVQKGFASEHMAPFQTKYNPKDFRHIGDPVDYLIFSGSTEIKDGTTDEIEEVVILDIKTGKADLNKTQRRIRDAIVAGKVSFATYNPDTNSLRTWNQTSEEE